MLKAVYTKPMKWSGAVGLFCLHVSERTQINLLKFVLLCLCVPFFKLSNLLFQRAYALNHRELILLGRECARLGGQNYALQFDDLRLEHLTVPEAYNRLRYVACGLERPHQCRDSSDIH